MITIGIRVQSDSVVFAIYDADTPSIANVESIKIPRALSFPDALKYVRNTVLDVLREYDVTQAGIRITESSAKNANLRRIAIEGVIQEAFASSSLLRYYTGQIATITALLGLPRTSFKLLVKGTENYDQVENWSDLTPVERESILTAMGAEHA